MLFNSLDFILFALILTILFRFAKGTKAIALLVASSLFFYSFTGEFWYLFPLLTSSLVDYVVGARIHKAHLSGGASKEKKAYLAISLAVNIGMLGYFKYWGFLLESWGALVGADAASVVTQIVLPTGISFYTFQTMCYSVDIYRGRLTPATSFLNYMAYVSFFPQLIAGPIARYQDLGASIERFRAGQATPAWREGIALFSIGLCKKVLIADRVANGINPLISCVDEAGLWTSWLLMIGYSTQLYFDFSGYSDMALGLGKCFGIELPINFKSPYKSKNPSDFWRRWHITLSEWIRDYIYFPLGGSRGGAASAAQNLVLTMTIGGLWHGASWTFVVWGLYHGLLLALYHALKERFDALPVAAQRALTLLCVFVGWIPFRSDSFAQAGSWLAGLLGAHGLSGGERLSLPYTGLIVASLLIALLAPNAYEMRCSSWSARRWCALGVATAAALLMMNYSSTFIYYRF